MRPRFDRFFGRKASLRCRSYAVMARRTLRRYIWDFLSYIPGHIVVLMTILSGEELPVLESVGKIEKAPTQVSHYQGNLLLEGRYGYIISPQAILHDMSYTYGWTTHTQKGREVVGLPSVMGYLSSRLFGLNQTDLDIKHAVSLMSPWGENYYHFLLDVLPKLYLIDRTMSTYSPNILVHSDLYDTKFFTQFRELSNLKHLNFMTLDKRSYASLSDVLTAYYDFDDLSGEVLTEVANMVDNSKPKYEAITRRIFITRSPERGRSLENIDDICRIATRHGFEILDFDDVDLLDQVNAFRQSRFIVAIHGAALANLIFAAPAYSHILEIHPPVDDIDCFKILAGRLDISFDRVFGEVDGEYFDKRQDFHLDESVFINALSRLLECAVQVSA